MITDAQRDQAKAHGFHFYERMAGRADDPAQVSEIAQLTSWPQVITLVKHLREVLHHPDFIVADLLEDMARRYGSKDFIAACVEVSANYKRLGKDSGGRMLDALCAEEVS